MTMHPHWWEEVLGRIRTERLALVAASVGLEEFELIAYLVVDGAGRPAESTPWWPEVLAMRGEGTSLREIARRFQTEPRRLRRALARQGLRAAGVDLAADQGLPVLAGMRERLGFESDTVVAKAAKVAVEAVKGERRRLGVAPYYQRPRVRLTPDDEAWIRGPKKLRRERFRPEPDVLKVVRRPQTRPGEEVRRAAPEPRRDEALRVPPPTRSVEGPGRSFFRDDRWAEIERLTEPTVRRDGNRRLVRAPEPRRPSIPSDEGAAATAVTPPANLPGIGAPPAPPVASPDPAAAAAPSGTRRIVTPPRPVGSPVAPPTVHTRPGRVAASAAAVARDPSPVPVAEEVAWRVEIPGGQTVTVFAVDIAGAVRKAAEKVPAHLLARASIWRADQPAPGVDHL